MHAEKTLGGSSRFEPLHFAFSSSHRLMRVFGSIVFAQPLLMQTIQLQTPECGGVERSLSVTSDFGEKPCFLSSLRNQSQRRPSVAPTLNQHVENLALVIDGTPQIHLPAGDPHHHLGEVPTIARPRTAPA